jgi:tRNA 2-thiouridine synthesizing protein C
MGNGAKKFMYVNKGQDTTESNMKNFSPTYRALGDYEVNKLYVEKESLDQRGMSEDDLMELTYEDEDDDYKEKPSIRIVNREELVDLMEQQDVILNY